MILCGAGLRAALVLRASVPCARFISEMGMRRVIGQCAMGTTVMQGEPCRIMARVSGRVRLASVVRAVGTSGRRFR